MQQVQTDSQAREALLDAAQAMQGTLRARSAACNAGRSVPAETIEDFRNAGFFRMLQPRRYGGLELSPSVFYEVNLALARACPSSAWVMAVVGVHNWQLALFDARAAEDVWGDEPATLISSSYAPVGRIRAVDGGYRLSGKYSFSSGCQHCDWVMLGGIVPDAESGAMDMKNFRTFLLPAADYRIEENWDVIGLKGTGSHDVVVEDAFVPAYRTHGIMDAFRCDSPGNAVNSQPLYRLPWQQVFVRAVSNATLGACEAVLDEFISLCDARVVMGRKLRDDDHAKNLIARVSNELANTRCVMHAHFDQMLQLATAGQPIPVADRVRYRYESAAIARRCLDLSTDMLTLSGSAGIRQDSRLLALHLDILASQAHIANYTVPLGINMGGTLLGGDTSDYGI
ncbi:acyl-CoA dehydrogenase family protein [Parahaliea mediterranea]|uniref:acyl-CoA dehydrogenase family protein n=1 Tax=Parahaliea mediterranea TaxID=651086 RepID=UPI000E2FAEBA|nr:acyl-CoA dehydrogenase family protein [Parahaliea mediterranea]